MMLRPRIARLALAAPPSQLPTSPAGATVTPLFPPAPPHAPAPSLPARLMSLRTLSFVIAVLLPITGAAIYYFAIAADQYVAEFRMTLRTVDPPPIEPLLLFGGSTTRTMAATESQIVTQYIASRAIIDELDPQLDLRGMFATSTADWFARLRLPASIEQLVYYWQDQVDPFYDSSTGTIVVRARGFTPEDALRLAQAIVGSSEKLVNTLSARARRDAVRYGETEVATAEARLKTALAAIREFRDREGIIDPGKAVDANATLAARLRDDLLKANSELATLKAYMHDDAPPVRVLKARIRSLETQQRALAHEVTAEPAPQGAPPAPAPALSQELGSYDALDAERRFAETAYQHALDDLDRARDDANRQHLYIESFVPPSLPQASLYPRRWRSLGIVALIAFAVWAIGGLAVQSVRDHV